MELKRPFTEEDFQATPEPVRQYIIQLIRNQKSMQGRVDENGVDKKAIKGTIKKL